MSPTAVDTSVLIAALLGWHEFHRPAFLALSAAAGQGALVIPAHALVEAYAVMTRLPSPHRLAPARALELLAGSLEGRSTVIGMNGAETWELLRHVSAKGVVGGATYDAAIFACAVQAGARKLLTLDGDDFRRFDTLGVEIVVPS